MIKVEFRTNLDGYDFEEWPMALRVRPLVGDRVAAKSRRELKVVSVRHEFDGTLAVELHR